MLVVFSAQLVCPAPIIAAPKDLKTWVNEGKMKAIELKVEGAVSDLRSQLKG